MSRNVLRKDKTCLNCRHVVENRFCPNCGQENSDTRKTFYHLFIHFFEDLTHYENAFWKTIKNLLFRPASLTKEYLSGKRLSYLAPVRLYIFISFVAFFIIAMFPDEINADKILNPEKKKEKEILFENKSSGFKITKNNNSYNNDTISEVENKKIPLTLQEKEILKLLESKQVSKATKDTILKLIEKSKELKLANEKKGYLNFRNCNNLKQLDSLRKFGKGDDELNDFEYWFFKKALKVKEKNTKEEILEKGIDSAKRNIPKVLIIYMPFFALFLWLFHGKKRWYYFDHGIFTLHYFSFLLLLFLIIFTIASLLEMTIKPEIDEYISNGIFFIGFGWMFYYFFPAHHRFYGETRLISFVKSFFLFFINMFFILLLMIFFFLYTLINIH